MLTTAIFHFLLLLHHFLLCDTLASDVQPHDESVYKSLLKHKHADQLQMVQTILGMNNYAKQYKMVTVAVEQIIKVMTKSRVILENAGYIPGNVFPEDEPIRDALAMVVENTILFGEMILRLPDISHKILNGKKDGQLLIKWSISFCNETNLITQPIRNLLHLVAQELDIIDKDPNYINPYKVEQRSQPMDDKEEIHETKPKKKVKKQKAKGPRLSSERHIEL